VQKVTSELKTNEQEQTFQHMAIFRVHDELLHNALLLFFARIFWHPCQSDSLSWSSPCDWVAWLLVEPGDRVGLVRINFRW